jgi:hypothetical protein
MGTGPLAHPSGRHPGVRDARKIDRDTAPINPKTAEPGTIPCT